MCGGSDRDDRTIGEKPVEYTGTYTPPSLGSLYDQFRSSGTVPYSYYGAGAPNRSAELEAVRKAYPGAFKDLPAPPAPSKPDGRRRSPFEALFGPLFFRKG